MSKLSVHHTSPGLSSGFGDNLQKCTDAGSPFGTAYSLNGNIGPDLAAHSPSTRWIYRRQSDAFPRVPDDIFVNDPAISAANWLTGIKDSQDQNRTLIQNWKLNPADWFDPLNEPVADTPEKAAWLNTWMLTALEIANAYGFKLALFSFSTGSPPLDMWQYLLPALRRGKQLGAILSLHAYWEGDPSLDHNNALRYRDIYALLPDDARIPIVITEASNGNGYNTGLSGQGWVDDMAKYDGELMKDSYLLGACGFQLGGNESNLVDALSLYGDHIAANPTPVTPPPPPPPVGTRGDPRIQYPRTYNVIPANVTDARAAEIFMAGWQRSRETAGGSYDDGGIGNLDSRTVNLWDIPQADQQTYRDWYATNYPGVVVNFPASATPVANAKPGCLPVPKAILRRLRWTK